MMLLMQCLFISAQQVAVRSVPSPLRSVEWAIARATASR